MSKKKHNYDRSAMPGETTTPQSDTQTAEQTISPETEQTANTAQEEETAPVDESEQLHEQITQLTTRVQELEDLKLRQMAEFDNYRRRTNKEKLELLDIAGERIFTDILPLVDDFERAKDAMVKTDDINAVREGIELIYSKFLSFLDKNNVHVIETEGVDFSTDEHEAITTFAAGEDKKGKIIDCTQKGYKLGEKVIRFAKVVVGE